MTRAPRFLAAPLLALGLLLGPAVPAPAQLDEGGEAPAQSSGDPWVGSAVALAFAGAVIFIVCKSARRSMSGG